MEIVAKRAGAVLSQGRLWQVACCWRARACVRVRVRACVRSGMFAQTELTNMLAGAAGGKKRENHMWLRKPSGRENVCENRMAVKT